MLMLVFLVLGFAMLDALSEFLVAWLHSTSMRHFLDETIWDASPWCWLLRAYPSLSAPCDAMFTMFIRTAYWLSLHLYTLAHMSMHESCLLVYHPYFHTMKLWTFNPNLHLSLVDTIFCSSFCLFVFSLVCLLACLPSCFLVGLFIFACHVSCHMLCLSCLSYLSTLCLFHMLLASFPFIACLLVSCLWLCMYTHGARTHGARA